MRRILGAPTKPLLSAVVLLAILPTAHAAQPFGTSAPGLNLVLSVSSAEETHEFYGEILGLKRLPDLDFPGETYMVRYKSGDSELRLIVTGQDLPKFKGGAGEGRGIRLMALLLPEAEREGIVERLTRHGHPEPTFTEGPGYRYAMAYDHDGNQVELVFLDEGTPAALKGFQIGLTVSDTDAMSAFLGDVLELKPLGPQPLPSGGTKYSYRMGSTIVKFWSGDKDLPTYVGSPLENIGMCLVQFLVPDVAAVQTTLLERGATIHTGPANIGTLGAVMFVEGPDGILFEFAGPPVKDAPQLL